MQKGTEDSPDLPVLQPVGRGVWILALMFFICHLFLAVLRLCGCVGFL